MDEQIYENYQQLAACILAEAVRDYRANYRRVLQRADNPNCKWGVLNESKADLKRAEEEFRSSYYAALLKGIGSDLDGELIPVFVRKQEDERYATKQRY